MEPAIFGAASLILSAIGMLESIRRALEEHRLSAKAEVKKLLIDLAQATKELEGHSINPSSSPQAFLDATTAIKRCMDELIPLITEDTDLKSTSHEHGSIHPGRRSRLSREDSLCALNFETEEVLALFN